MLTCPKRFLAKASGIEDGERELNALMKEIGWRTTLEYVKDPNGSKEGKLVRRSTLISFIPACNLKNITRCRREKPTIKRFDIPDIKRLGREGI